MKGPKLNGHDLAASLVIHGTCVVLAAALLLSAGCASNAPRASAPQTQIPPPPITQSQDAVSRRGQQDGREAQRSAQSPEEEVGGRVAAEAGMQADSTQPQPSADTGSAQRQAWPSDSQSGAAERDRQTAKSATASEQSGGLAAEIAKDTAIGAYPGGRTEEERRRGLDRDLDRSLTEFDERLQREQAELDQEVARAAAPRAATSGGGGVAIGRRDAIERTAAPPPPGVVDNGGDRPDVARDTPDDIPSGEDDDVVAHQLREAAENEQDPQLRKKLWEEYREYKENKG